MACSAEKRSAGSSDTDQFLLSSTDRFKEETPSTEISIRDPENESGVSKVVGTNESSSQGQEISGSSGKRKHSRWDSTPQADDLNVDDGVATTKQRRTRWAGEDSQVKLLGPMHLPGSVMRSTDLVIDPKVWKLKKQLLSVNRKLQAQESVDELQRDDEHREKLVKQKQCLIRKLVRKTKFVRKLSIPMKEYPKCNFTRLILGIRGETQRIMENETKARIMLRGKGSPKRKDAKPDPSDNEDLHVRIEADSQQSLDAAVAMVERLLLSVEDGKNMRGENAYKTGEMASRNDDKCEICGDALHFTIACPFAGKFLQTGAYENNVNFPAALGSEFSAFPRPPFPRNHPLDFRSAAHSVPSGSDEFNRDVDYTNLYVAHLSQYVDEGRLVELFSHFGPLAYAQVIRDKTTGLSKGHGFVKYVAPASAALAVERMNGYRLDGNMLAVCIAGPQPATPNNSMQAVERASISFPPAYQTSYFATNHIPAPPCWPGPPRPMMPETYDLTRTSYGSSYSRPMLSLTSAPNGASEELARFPGNPDKFASGCTSLFS